MEVSGTKSGLAAAANAAEPNTDVEQRVVDCYKALLAAELNFCEGVDFGNAVIALRAERKPQKDWMDRLEQLDITYAKARYWIAVVENKPTQGSKAEKADAPVGDWDAVLAKLKPLVDEIAMLKRRHKLGDSKLHGEFEKLAKILDYEATRRGDRS